MTDFRCPDCGNYRDTPMHQLGCVTDPADPPTFSRPHPTLSQPWGDPDYDHSCEDCREGRHGRLADKPRPYIDMLDPADPPSPLTARRAIARAIADSRKAFGVLRPDDLMDALERDGFMVVPLASSSAPAGLDADQWHAILKADPLLPDCSGTHMMGYAYCQRLAAATRPAEDADHG